MSGIAGIIYSDGRDVEQEVLERMVCSMSHRGPDGSVVWRQGAAGLGHCMLRTTPESLQERLPLSNGLYAITSDARIDNREELLRRLRLPGSPGAIPDSALILAAYERWGEGCVDRLLGDFAFAIWDAARRKLFCARDHCGIKPFYYYAGPYAFAFGSEIKALLQIEEVPRRVNEERAADYLAFMVLNNTYTFYKDILRLPPGHCLVVEEGRVHVRAYWTIGDSAPEEDLKSDEAYVEAFREIFTEAVRCRLRAGSTAGSMLSGGLDSSSITCVASRLRRQKGAKLPVFSIVFDEAAACDERKYMRLVLDREPGEWHSMPGDGADHRPLSFLTPPPAWMDEPSFAPNAAQSANFYRFIRDRGVSVILDGHGGDEVVSQGWGMLRELAVQHRWLALARELRPLSAAYGERFWESMYAYVRYGIGSVNTSPLRLLRRVGGPAFRALAKPAKKQEGAAYARFVAPDLAERVQLAERYRSWKALQVGPAYGETEQMAHLRLLRCPLQPYALEILDAAASAWSLEARYPFWDKRMVDFCLHVPARLRLRRGWGRWILRQAMENTVPENVRWRRDKTDFSPNLLQGIRNEIDAALDLLQNRTFLTQEYINVATTQDRLRQLKSGSDVGMQDVSAALRTIAFGSWLQSLENINQETPVHVPKLGRTAQAVEA